jgi:hypothetical protein
MDKKKKLPGVAIALVILLGIRALGQILIATASGGEGTIIFLALGAIYIAAVVGTVQRKNWAPILIIVIGTVDAIAAIGVLSGSASMGAILMDALLIILAVKDKKNIEEEGSTASEYANRPSRKK